jgi:cytoskeletal protein CcmA (bactofilin family)
MKNVFLSILWILSTLPVLAFHIVQGKEVVISQPVFDDLYITGGTITINAPVYGEVTIVGGTINLNDTITKDLLVAGGDIIMNGYAGNNIRVVGGRIQILGNVAGDLVAAGGNINISRGVTVGGVLVAGGSVYIDGTVKGNIKSVEGQFTLNGIAENEVDCSGGNIMINGRIQGFTKLGADEIIIGDQAVFEHDVNYWARKRVDFKQSLKNAKAIFDPALKVQSGEWYFLGAGTLMVLLWYLGMAFIIILLIQWLFPTIMRKAADVFFEKTLQSFGYGTLFLVGIPIAAVIAFITIVGVPIGVMLVGIYISTLLLATILTAVVTANWLNNRVDRKWKFWRLSFASFGLFIFYKLVTLMPAIGWLVMLVLVIVSIGSILININWRLKKPGELIPR